MGLAETAKLVATLDLAGNFSKNLGGASRSLRKFGGDIDKTQSKANQAGQHIGIGIRNGAILAATGIGILTTNIGLGLKSLVELEQQQAQTNAAIKSTKGVAGITAKAVGDLSEKYEAMNATVGDEVIRSTENMLLTFTNVRKQAFEPALQAILDMNTRMGKGPEGLTSTAIQVGKALNDPVKGLTALSKVGVTFDKDQTKRIKSLVKEGKTYEAQKIILAELNKEFGGSFLAQGQTTAGKVAKFGDAIDDLQRKLAAGLLPVVSNVADALSEFLADPQTGRDIEQFGKDLAQFFSKENIRAGIDLLKSGFNAIKAIAEPILSIIGGVVSAFRALPPDIQKFLIGAVALNKLTGGGVLNIAVGFAKDALGGLFTRGASPVNPMFVQQVGGIPAAGGGAVGGAAKAGLSTVGKLFLIGEAIGLIAAVNEVRNGISEASSRQAEEVHTQTQKFIASQPSQSALLNSLNGVDKGIRDIKSNPLNVLVQGSALDELQGMRADILKALGTNAPGKLADDLAKPIAPVEQAIVDLKGKTADDLATLNTTGTGTTNAARIAGMTAAQAARSAGSGIETAIRNNRPITNIDINVSATTVQSTYNVITRYGSPTSDRYSGKLNDPGLIGG